MKGVLLTSLPGVQVVDVTHSVPPFDIRGGAFVLWAGTRDFPRGSVHLAVVDPGVGTERRRIAFETERGSFYVGPDNGVFTRVLEDGPVRAAIVLEPRSGASPTFEGRDVFAPVAAALAASSSLRGLGEEMPGGFVTLPGGAHSVVWVDRFGNLVTDLRPPLSGVRIGRHDIVRHARTFGEADGEEPFWYIGSLGFVEVGVREGRADAALRVDAGTIVERI